MSCMLGVNIQLPAPEGAVVPFKYRSNRGGWGDGANLGRSIGPDPKVVRDQEIGEKRRLRKLSKKH